MKALHGISYVLVIIGGLNWGLIGLGRIVAGPNGWNVVHMVLGSLGGLETLVYVLVGIGALILLFSHK